MSRCRNCQAEIQWVETPNGRLMPIDADQVSHFARCPAARKPAPPQDVCLSCGSRDLERLPGKGPHHGAIRCRVCGAHRWLRTPV